MAFNKKKKKTLWGVATSILVITIVTMIISAIFAKFGFQAEKTIVSNGILTVSYTSIKNFLSIEGIKYLFSNIVLNFRMFEPIALVIISIIA